LVGQAFVNGSAELTSKPSVNFPGFTFAPLPPCVRFSLSFSVLFALQ
jgi:hypothetical protein